MSLATTKQWGEQRLGPDGKLQRGDHLVSGWMVPSVATLVSHIRARSRRTTFVEISSGRECERTYHTLLEPDRTHFRREEVLGTFV